MVTVHENSVSLDRTQVYPPVADTMFTVATLAELPAVGTEGEQYLVQETGSIYWWDPTANAGAGGWTPTNAAQAQPTSIDYLTDVDTTTEPPHGPDNVANSGSQQGTVLVFDGNNHVPKEFSYRHIQGTADTLWTVNHNLGRRVSAVYIENSFGEECLADITQVSDNQLTITFAAEESGKAYIM